MKLSNEGLTRKLKGWSLPEITLGIVIVMLLMAGAFFGFTEYKDNANRATAKQDMRMIKSAIMTYSGLNINSLPPSDLGVLLSNPSLEASEAIDGVDHGAFLESKRGWGSEASSIRDPWGNPYEYTYDAATREGTITSTGGGNKPISETF